MLSNLATLGKHLELVFLQHILLCFKRRCQGSSFTATQGRGRGREMLGCRLEEGNKGKIPDICCFWAGLGRILRGQAMEGPHAELCRCLLVSGGTERGGLGWVVEAAWK